MTRPVDGRRATRRSRVSSVASGPKRSRRGGRVSSFYVGRRGKREVRAAGDRASGRCQVAHVRAEAGPSVRHLAAPSFDAQSRRRRRRERRGERAQKQREAPQECGALASAGHQAEGTLSARWARSFASSRLERSVPERATSPPRRSGSRTRRRRRSKTALVLGGGGFTGGVYEIGALRALDLLSVNRTVNQFDVYVGTCAGSFVAALTANGVTPEEMMRVVNQQVAHAVPRRRPRQLLRPNSVDFAKRAALMPLRAARPGARARRRSSAQVSAMDLVARAGRGPAVGPLLRRRASSATCATVLSRPRPHRRLPDARQRALPRRDRPRHLRAHRLRRRGLGRRPDLRRPCAPRPRCRWSTSPSRSSDRELVDGGIVSTTNLDIAVEAGAKFVVVVNPLVPYVNDFTSESRRCSRHRAAPRQRHGLPADRLPGVQADGLPAPARDGAPVGAALPGRRHRPDRARARRRADVPDVDHELRQRASTSRATASSR